jgi:hypothetical protein
MKFGTGQYLGLRKGAQTLRALDATLVDYDNPNYCKIAVTAFHFRHRPSYWAVNATVVEVVTAPLFPLAAPVAVICT